MDDSEDIRRHDQMYRSNTFSVVLPAVSVDPYLNKVKMNLVIFELSESEVFNYILADLTVLLIISSSLSRAC